MYLKLPEYQCPKPFRGAASSAGDGIDDGGTLSVEISLPPRSAGGAADRKILLLRNGLEPGIFLKLR